MNLAIKLLKIFPYYTFVIYKEYSKVTSTYLALVNFISSPSSLLSLAKCITFLVIFSRYMVLFLFYILLIFFSDIYYFLYYTHFIFLSFFYFLKREAEAIFWDSSSVLIWKFNIIKFPISTVIFAYINFDMLYFHLHPIQNIF